MRRFVRPGPEAAVLRTGRPDADREPAGGESSDGAAVEVAAVVPHGNVAGVPPADADGLRVAEPVLDAAWALSIKTATASATTTRDDGRGDSEGILLLVPRAAFGRYSRRALSSRARLR